MYILNTDLTKNTVELIYGGRLPFPQVFEQWLIMGLQTYTGAWFVIDDKPDFIQSCSCWGKHCDVNSYIIVHYESRVGFQLFPELPLPLIPTRWDKHLPHRAQNPLVWSALDKSFHPLQHHGRLVDAHRTRHVWLFLAHKLQSIPLVLTHAICKHMKGTVHPKSKKNTPSWGAEKGGIRRRIDWQGPRESPNKIIILTKIMWH